MASLQLHIATPSGFWVRRLLGLALAGTLAFPVLARPQSPSQPAPPPANPAPQTAPTTGPTQDPTASAPQQPAPSQTSPGDSKQSPAKDAKKDDTPIPQKEKPNVKAGSKQDVDAIGNRGVGKGLNMYSLEREMALGKSLAQEIERSSKLIDDPVVSEYVNRVGQNLVRNSDAKVPFTIKVIDSDVVNAFALPGGFFYVHSGLILRADTEAELAGVMAHEIAHVAARHGTKDATKGQVAQIAMIPLILLGPGGWAGYGIYEGLNFAIPMSFLKFSREHEYEADYLGLQYMYAAGYDPNAFVTFFEKVEAEEKRQPGTVPKFFSTHPPTPERVIAIQKEIGNVLPARDQYMVTTSEFDTVKARLRGIEDRNKLREDKTNKDKPTLRTRTERQQPQAGQGGQQPGAQGGNSPSEDPDRPTLKRRPEDDPNSPGGQNPNNQ
jgi:Zn-dependent protease with chaperone function